MEGLKKEKISYFEVTTPDVDYSSENNLANKAEWLYNVYSTNGKLIKKTNYMAALFYKYKHGGSIARCPNGVETLSSDGLIDEVDSNIEKRDFVQKFDYPNYFDKEQKAMNESTNRNTFVFLDRSAKTLRGAVITESDDILKALNQVQDKTVKSPEVAYNELLDLDCLPDNAVVLVVDNDSEESVFGALDNWIDDKLAANQIEPDMFMANRNVAAQYTPDYAEIIEQPNNAVALGVESPISGGSIESPLDILSDMELEELLAPITASEDYIEVALESTPRKKR